MPACVHARTNRNGGREEDVTESASGLTGGIAALPVKMICGSRKRVPLDQVMPMSLAAACPQDSSESDS
jgi:hypothetical protein